MMPRPKEVRRIIDSALASGRLALAEDAAKLLLAAYSIDVPRRIFVPVDEAAGSALGELRFPVVVKVVSPTILHKTEAGGVRLCLGDVAAVETAIAEMHRAITRVGHVIEGWLVEEMAPKGVEMVIGGTVDPSFGPTVVVGLGGIFVELIEDVSFRLCPIQERDAAEMINELRGAKLLHGWRGAPKVDEEAVRRVLMHIGGKDGLMMGLAEAIEEVDINPLIVLERGAVAADARIILRKALS